MSISEEAIEAAAEALEARSENDDWEWCLGDAKAALTAAAPYIQAAALRDAAEVVQEECYIRSGDCFCGSAEWLRARADRLEAETK